MGDSWDLSANAAGYPEETNCNQPRHRMEGRYYLKLQDDMLEFLSSRAQVERSSAHGEPSLGHQASLTTYTMNIPPSSFQPVASMRLYPPYFSRDDTPGPCLVTLQNDKP